MATNVNVRIDNPSESGMEHYVGLEHLDTDTLKIRRWGTPDDVEATKLMFKKGDIVAYNVNVHAVPLSNNHDPLLFFESGFLFSPDGDKSMEDLKEFLEESPFIEDVINKIKIYEKLGSLK